MMVCFLVVWYFWSGLIFGWTHPKLQVAFTSTSFPGKLPTCKHFKLNPPVEVLGITQKVGTQAQTCIRVSLQTWMLNGDFFPLLSVPRLRQASFLGIPFCLAGSCFCSSLCWGYCSWGCTSNDAFRSNSSPGSRRSAVTVEWKPALALTSTPRSLY